MTNKKPAGGSAFPTMPIYNGGETIIEAGPGMTLRDWFAGQALAGYTANPEVLKALGDHNRPPEDMARMAFKTADLMIAERDK